tara:strand:+ start:917 stop:1087 length:171 start_codon:yes stop_codon:yes gene_type:complete
MKKKIKYYRIITAARSEDVTKAMNTFIRDGWIPQGGITCSIGKAGTQWAQAIIKKR